MVGRSIDHSLIQLAHLAPCHDIRYFRYKPVLQLLQLPFNGDAVLQDQLPVRDLLLMGYIGGAGALGRAASVDGRVDLVNALLAGPAGASALVADEKADTALHVAAAAGKDTILYDVHLSASTVPSDTPAVQVSKGVGSLLCSLSRRIWIGMGPK